MAKVFVVNWTVTELGVGGFEWRWKREDAEKAMAEFRADDHTITMREVELPDEVASLTNEEITDWLDSEGWSDGGDPR